MKLFQINFEIQTHEQVRKEGELAGRNRKLWEEGRLPEGPTDIMIGDMVLPLEPYWMRGAGRVSHVSFLGNVTIKFDSCVVSWGRTEAITCHEHWNRLVIIERY